MKILGWTNNQWEQAFRWYQGLGLTVPDVDPARPLAHYGVVREEWQRRGKPHWGPSA